MTCVLVGVSGCRPAISEAYTCAARSRCSPRAALRVRQFTSATISRIGSGKGDASQRETVSGENGLPAATSTGLALLALRTDAAVLPGYISPRPNGRYWIKFLPPVPLIRTGDSSHDVACNTRVFNQILEGIIREQPDIWLWGHRRWKNQPEGVPDFYRLSLPNLRKYLAEKQAVRL